MVNNHTPNEITVFGETNFRNQQQRFGIKLDDRRRHMYIIGKTGMGKTTLLENMIVADIRAGYGLAVVDPHGDLTEKLLDYIPSNRINDIIYFNPADIDYPIAFNVLESVNPVHRHLVASGLVGVFKKIWADSWGPRLEYVLRNTVLSLLEYPGSTLLGITRILVDNKFRKKVLQRLADPILRTFWTEEYAAYSNQFRTEAISPIQNKVGQFLSSSIIRNIVGQTKSSIDMRTVMDDGKILLLNLSKGRIGEDNAALLGAMMITKLQLAAMSRVDVPELQRRDFVLYVDEFQNFATESFANILSEARKYRLDLVIAHQYIEQLDETVQAAVFGNVGTIVCFRVGAADAEFLEKEFEPVFMQNDLVNLTKFEMYLKLMIDGVASEPFSARGLPPLFTPEGGETREKIVRVSRERYSASREVVEEKILRWAGLEAGLAGEAESGKPMVNDDDNGDRNNVPRPEQRHALKINLAGNPEEEEDEAGENVQIVQDQPAVPQAISLKEALSREPVFFKQPRRPDNQSFRQSHQPSTRTVPGQPPPNRHSRQPDNRPPFHHQSLKPKQVIRFP